MQLAQSASPEAPAPAGPCQVNAAGAICKPGSARAGGMLSGERSTRDAKPRERPRWRDLSGECSSRDLQARGRILDGKLPAQRSRRKPQRHSVSLLDQNRAAELRFAADKGPRQVVLTVSA
jgi:hypothetical protein